MFLVLFRPKGVRSAACGHPLVSDGLARGGTLMKYAFRAVSSALLLAAAGALAAVTVLAVATALVVAFMAGGRWAVGADIGVGWSPPRGGGRGAPPTAPPPKAARGCACHHVRAAAPLGGDLPRRRRCGYQTARRTVAGSGRQRRCFPAQDLAGAATGSPPHAPGLAAAGG